MSEIARTLMMMAEHGRKRKEGKRAHKRATRALDLSERQFEESQRQHSNLMAIQSLQHGIEKRKLDILEKQFGENLKWLKEKHAEEIGLGQRQITSRENIAEAGYTHANEQLAKTLGFQREKLSTETGLREKEIDYRGRYTDALAALTRARTDLMMDADLRNTERQIKANQALFTKQQLQELTAKNDFFSDLLASDDPQERAALRSFYTGVKENESLRTMIDALMLENSQNRTRIDMFGYLLNKSKHEQDILISQLGLLTDPYASKVFEKHIGSEPYNQLVMDKALGFVGAPKDIQRTEPIGGTEGFFRPALGFDDRRLPAERSAEEAEEIDRELQQQIENLQR